MSKEKRTDIKELSTKAIDGLMNLLLDAKDEAKATDTMKRYLSMQGKQYSYSWRNLALIFNQKPDARFVAPYAMWQKIFKEAGAESAYIKKGSGIQVTVPMYKKIEKEDGTTDKRTFFGSGNVFDVSDVVGFDLSQLNHDDTVNAGLDMAATYQYAINQYMQHSLVAGIEEQELDAECGGYAKRVGESDGKAVCKIALNSGRNDAEKLKTLFHEMAHTLLHFDKDFRSTEGKHARSVAELEAESVAFVCATHLGIDASDSSFYLACWEGKKEMAQQSLKRIAETAKTLINLLKESE